MNQIPNITYHISVCGVSVSLHSHTDTIYEQTKKRRTHPEPCKCTENRHEHTHTHTRTQNNNNNTRTYATHSTNKKTKKNHKYSILCTLACMLCTAYVRFPRRRECVVCVRYHLPYRLHICSSYYTILYTHEHDGWHTKKKESARRWRRRRRRRMRAHTVSAIRRWLCGCCWALRLGNSPVHTMHSFSSYMRWEGSVYTVCRSCDWCAPYCSIIL